MSMTDDLLKAQSQAAMRANKIKYVDWVEMIAEMHAKFGVSQWVEDKLEKQDYESLRQFLAFRVNFLHEELLETETAFSQGDVEEIVDGLIDLCVIAIGTLDILGVDAHKAWHQVHNANMAKEPGIKPSRPNPLGLPDMIKPEGWVGPDHSDNHGDGDMFAYHEEELPKW